MGRRKRDQRPAKRITVRIGDIVEIFPLDREYLPNRQEGFRRAKALRSAALQYLKQCCNIPPDPVNDFLLLEPGFAVEDRDLEFSFASEPNELTVPGSTESGGDLHDISVNLSLPWQGENCPTGWNDQLW
jgi:hypothetical protein